jgi:hypothetical protein
MSMVGLDLTIPLCTVIVCYRFLVTPIYEPQPPFRDRGDYMGICVRVMGMQAGCTLSDRRCNRS